MNSVKDFREVRRALPRENVFNIQYEDMLDEDMRVRILERLVDFIGALTAAGVGAPSSRSAYTKAAHDWSSLTYAAPSSHMQD